MNDISMNDLGIRVHLELPYEEAMVQVTAALKAEGFGVLTQIDVRDTLKQKLDVDFRRYAILGACNPPLAHRAFATEIEIGLLLPCNVIIYEDDDGLGTEVAIIDPISMLGMGGINPSLAPVGDEAAERLRRVQSSLEAL